MDIKPLIFPALDQSSQQGVNPSPSSSAGFSPIFPHGSNPYSGMDGNPQDIKFLEDAAYKKGFEAGSQEATAKAQQEADQVSQQLLNVSSNLQNELTALRQSYDNMLNTLPQEFLLLAGKISHSIAGGALKQDPSANIRSIIDDCLPYILPEPNITIYLHPSMIEYGKEHFTPLLEQARFAGNATFQGDEHIGEYDCRVEWKNGGLKTNVKEIWDSISDIIAKQTNIVYK